MPLTVAECPPPRTLPTGELECPVCGCIWDKSDGEPECTGPEDES